MQDPERRRRAPRSAGSVASLPPSAATPAALTSAAHNSCPSGCEKYMPSSAKTCAAPLRVCKVARRDEEGRCRSVTTRTVMRPRRCAGSEAVGMPWVKDDTPARDDAAAESAACDDGNEVAAKLGDAADCSLDHDTAALRRAAKCPWLAAPQRSPHGPRRREWWQGHVQGGRAVGCEGRSRRHQCRRARWASPRNVVQSSTGSPDRQSSRASACGTRMMGAHAS